MAVVWGIHRKVLDDFAASFFRVENSFTLQTKTADKSDHNNTEDISNEPKIQSVQINVDEHNKMNNHVNRRSAERVNINQKDTETKEDLRKYGIIV
jgi:hypothetical protein